MSEAPKPGCFGSPACYQPSRDPCRVCPFNKACEAESWDMAMMLRDRHGITPLLAKGTSRPRAPQDDSILPQDLPQKARELLRTISPYMGEIRAALSKGSNPFVGRIPPPFLREPTDILLQQGSITRPALVQRWTNVRHWGEATASSHASFVLPALAHAGIIAPQGSGTWALSKASA